MISILKQIINLHLYIIISLYINCPLTCDVIWVVVWIVWWREHRISFCISRNAALPTYCVVWIKKNNWVFPKCFRWIRSIQWLKICHYGKRVGICHLLCWRPGYHHSAGMTLVSDRTLLFEEVRRSKPTGISFIRHISKIVFINAWRYVPGSLLLTSLFLS